MTNITQDPIHMHHVQDEATNLMQRETVVMREILSSMIEEHDALLINDTAKLKSIIHAREKLVSLAGQLRNSRITKVKELLQLLGQEVPGNGHLNDSVSLDILFNSKKFESCEILCLRDQILALAERMAVQNDRNNYLIKSKISYTKELIYHLSLKNQCPTYDPNGAVNASKNVKTMTIINHKG